VFNAALCTCNPGSGDKQCEPCGQQVAKVCPECQLELDKKSWSATKKLSVVRKRCNDREKDNVYKKIIDLLDVVERACHHGEPLIHGVRNRKEGKQWNWVDDAARALSLLTKVELRSGETDKNLVLSSSDDFTLDSLTNINLELKRLEAREAKLTQEGSECSVVNHLKRFSKILNSNLQKNGHSRQVLLNLRIFLEASLMSWRLQQGTVMAAEKAEKAEKLNLLQNLEHESTKRALPFNVVLSPLTTCTEFTPFLMSSCARLID